MGYEEESVSNEEIANSFDIRATHVECVSCGVAIERDKDRYSELEGKCQCAKCGPFNTSLHGEPSAECGPFPISRGFANGDHNTVGALMTKNMLDAMGLPLPDMVNEPPHYKLTIKGVEIECLDLIEALGLGFHLGNAFKYLFRAGRKYDALEDLKKSRFYLDRKIKELEGD